MAPRPGRAPPRGSLDARAARGNPDHVPEPSAPLQGRTEAPLGVLVALHVLDKVEQGHEAAYLLSRASRRARLPPDERALPVELTYGALRAINRLDRAVAIAVRGEVPRLEPWRRQFLRVAALLGEQGQKLDILLPWARELASYRDRRRDAERQAVTAAQEARDFLTTPEGSSTPELALRTGHPEWFAGTMRQLLGHEAPAFLRANNEEPPLVVRANLLKTTREDLVQRLATEGFRAEPTRFSPLGLRVEPKQGAFAAKSFSDGLFEAQDEGSQLLGLLVAPQPGEWVLDACAGAGGKTLLLAAQMRNKGRVVALDTAPGRLLELKRRAARAGADNYESFVVADDGVVQSSARAHRRGEDPGSADREDDDVDRKPPVTGSGQSRGMRKQYDAVLVDAPCSGLGTLRRTPELRWRHTPQTIAAYPPRQLGILERAAARVKPGGRLVYGTCTVLPEENEGVVQRFLAGHPEFQLRDASGALPAEAKAGGLTDGSGFLRTWPHRHGTEAFFGALLARAPA